MNNDSDPESNSTTITDGQSADECEFDPYWIYALVVPFLGVIFNGLLLYLCASIGRGHRPRRRASTKWTHQLTDYFLHTRSSTTEDPTTALCGGGSFDRATPIAEDQNHKPEFALNSVVANCALSTLLASSLRTITTSYLFTLNYVLCPTPLDTDERASRVMEILLYAQHSIFNVAYINFLIVLNLDKLLFIIKPLHYRSVMTRRRVIAACVLTWILSSAWLPLYFAQNEEDAVRWGTILVTILMVGPSVFCLITSTILAVVVFKVQMQDRIAENPNGTTSGSSKGYVWSKSAYWAYGKSVFRLFQSALFTFLLSLPHPLSIIISYYAAVADPTAHAVLKFVIGYLSIAYFTVTPFMIILTYPAYWRRLKFYFL